MARAFMIWPETQLAVSERSGWSGWLEPEAAGEVAH
jgi:hypothetical protein